MIKRLRRIGQLALGVVALVACGLGVDSLLNTANGQTDPSTWPRAEHRTLVYDGGPMRARYEPLDTDLDSDGTTREIGERYIVQGRRVDTVRGRQFTTDLRFRCNLQRVRRTKTGAAVRDLNVEDSSE